MSMRAQTRLVGFRLDGQYMVLQFFIVFNTSLRSVEYGFVL